jgi:nicotinamidase/pyrazinamidase
VRKGDRRETDAYSAFDGTDLDEWLRQRKVTHLFVVGLATDYCVRATVLDGLKLGYEVYAVTDAMRAVDVKPGDGATALDEMAKAGAHLVTSSQL